MKRVTKTTRRFGKKDILTWLLIILGHYASFATYILIFLTAKYYTMGGDFIPNDSDLAPIVYLTFIIAPFVNAVLHIVYDEIGSPWTRVAMWIHSFFHMLFLPILIFVFL